MEANEFICSHCGTSLTSANVDMKTRRGICPMCGCEVNFAKKHSTASPNAVLALEEGLRLFLSGNFESARTCAETAISMTEKNVAALFIVSYYKAYRAPVKNTKSLYDMFNNILPDAEFEIEEEEMFKQCVLKTIGNTVEFEEQLLAKFNDFDDPDELGQFVESFCPYAINTRQSYRWLTPRMISIYLEITKKVNIPKTWYSLYTALLKNPESPFTVNTFFQIEKTNRIQRDVVEPMGQIFNAIKDEALKAKFVSAYNAYYAKFVAAANAERNKNA